MNTFLRQMGIPFTVIATKADKISRGARQKQLAPICRALFVQHEMANPGAAFEILYAKLWSPGIGLTALLIRAASGNRLDERAAWVRAVMMIGSLTSLISGRPIITRTAGDDDLEQLVLASLREQIAQLA